MFLVIGCDFLCIFPFVLSACVCDAATWCNEQINPISGCGESLYLVHPYPLCQALWLCFCAQH